MLKRAISALHLSCTSCWYNINDVRVQSFTKPGKNEARSKTSYIYPSIHLTHSFLFPLSSGIWDGPVSEILIHDTKGNARLATTRQNIMIIGQI